MESTESDSVPEHILTQMVEAMEKALLSQLRERLAEVDLKADELETFFSSLAKESDRAIAVVVFSYIDERLKDLFAAVMNPEITGGVSSLLESFGPLATASSRIQIAAALYWITPATYKNLNLLRKIRNEFAHTPFMTGFDHAKVASLLSSMHKTEEPILELLKKEGYLRSDLSNRQRFLARSVATIEFMIVEMATAPIAQRMGLSPDAALAKGYNELPDCAKRVERGATRAVLEGV